MRTATRKQKAPESVKVAVASERLGYSGTVVRQMIELGYFTKRRNNPLSPKANWRIYSDEIDRYLELVAQGVKPPRMKAAMLQYRDEMGRK